MDGFEKKTGGSVLAIPHSGNLSNGRMFPVVEAFGKKIDREYAETRAKWERLYETTQTKGTGESHPFLSPNDELADFYLPSKKRTGVRFAAVSRPALSRPVAVSAAVAVVRTAW